VYEEFYGFTEPPFSLTPDPRFFYNGESHIRAFELLRYAIHRGEGFMVVYGDIGTGKTTLCRTVLENLQGDVYTALLLNPFLSETDLLRAILQDFGVISPRSPGARAPVSKHDLISSLNTFLLSIMRLDAHAMVLIDEAQNIPIATPLEQIRILTNLETTKQKLLQVVLVGQTELKDVLARPELRQLNQRISIRCELLPLSRDETAEYIRHRISVASGGSARVRFAPDALKVVHEYSGGIPRLINLIGDRCLILGLATEANTIDRKIAREAVNNLELRKVKVQRPLLGRPEKLPRAARVAIVVGIAVLLSGLLVWGFNSGVLTRWFNSLSSIAR
jgi:general secretion pathway protein A